jgi:glycosyltransferase involved in cell wall biosynthesis
VPKIAALAALATEVTVLAASADASALPSNSRFRRFEAPTRIGRGLRFESALAREFVLKPRPAAVVAHMCPIYAVLAAPLARALGVPILLWYAHWHASPTLRAAERVSTAVLTVDRRSFPLASRKLRPIGHGIDVAEFPCVEPARGHGGVRVLALGRYSPAKGLAAIVHGIHLALERGADVSLDVHGPTLSQGERRHRAEIERLVDELGVGGRVRLRDPVPRSALPALFREHDVLVNNMRPGATDKVVFEAAASCLPVLASSPAFEGFLEERFRFAPDDAVGLAERLTEFATTDQAARAEIGRALRRRVVEHHSVEHWAGQVVMTAGDG